MARCIITDPQWLGVAVERAISIPIVGLVLYVWATSISFFPNRVPSIVFYYGVLLILAGAMAALCIAGFTYRWAEATEQGLVVHEGWYGVFWKDRHIPASTIIALEEYTERRRTVFASTLISGIRVRLRNDSTIVLAETSGTGEYAEAATEFRRVLHL